MLVVDYKIYISIHVCHRLLYFFYNLFVDTKMGKTKANKTGQDKAYLHPKSRKAKHLSTFQAHNDKAKKAQDLKMARLQSKAAKMMFFKERMEEMFLEDGTSSVHPKKKLTN